MNDETRYERLITDMLAGSSPSRAPARLRADIKTTTRRVRPRPRWLALIKEPPMRISSSVVVGSPTARITAFVAATIMLAILATGAVVAGATLLAEPEDGPIIVAQDGSGSYESIIDAVAAAQDGDVIRVRPGTYPGGIVVDKDITIRGQGGTDDIFIQIAPDGPTVLGVPFGIHLLDTTALVANLSIHGPDVAIGIAIDGGAPTLQGLEIVLEGEFTGSPRDAFRYFDGAAGTMTDVATDGYARILSGSSPTIERLDHTREGLWIAGTGTNPVIMNSEFSPDIYEGAQPTITDSYLVGAMIQGSDPVIRDSVFRNPAYEPGDDYDNSASDVAIDIVWSSPVLQGNRIGDHPIGIRVAGGAPTIEGNTIERNVIGLSVTSENGMTLTGNTFCDNGQDLEVADALAVTLDGNALCEATADRSD